MGVESMNFSNVILKIRNDSIYPLFFETLQIISNSFATTVGHSRLVKMLFCRILFYIKVKFIDIRKLNQLIVNLFVLYQGRQGTWIKQ